LIIKCTKCSNEFEQIHRERVCKDIHADKEDKMKVTREKYRIDGFYNYFGSLRRNFQDPIYVWRAERRYV